MDQCGVASLAKGSPLAAECALPCPMGGALRGNEFMGQYTEYAIRQIILYSLPVVISLTVTGWIERHLTKSEPPTNPFHALNTYSAWALPLIAIAVHQPVILALGKPVHSTLKATVVRFSAHLLLMLLGFALYTWALAHQPPTGLPPLHQWWAKVLMYFNLCIVMVHLLPLPGLLVGEIVQRYIPFSIPFPTIPHLTVIVLVILSITPLLNWLIGQPLIYPVYEELAKQASSLGH